MVISVDLLSGAHESEILDQLNLKELFMDHKGNGDEWLTKIREASSVLRSRFDRLYVVSGKLSNSDPSVADSIIIVEADSVPDAGFWFKDRLIDLFNDGKSRGADGKEVDVRGEIRPLFMSMYGEWMMGEEDVLDCFLLSLPKIHLVSGRLIVNGKPDEFRSYLLKIEDGESPEKLLKTILLKKYNRSNGKRLRFDKAEIEVQSIQLTEALMDRIVDGTSLMGGVEAVIGLH